jgi:hypothetical protein
MKIMTSSVSFSEGDSEQLYKELIAAATSEGIDEKSVVKPFVVILASRYRLFVGRAKWKEIRIHPKPTRNCGMDIYLVFSHPNIDGVISDITDCCKAGAGAVAAAIAAIISIIAGANGGTGAVSLAAFKGVFYACMYTKGITWASEIGVDLETENKSCGSWG